VRQHQGRANHNQLYEELIMTAHDCTAKPADLKNTPYLYPVIASTIPLHVNEDDEDYSSKSLNKAALNKLRIDTVILKRYIEQQLDIHKGNISLRIVRLFDDLTTGLKQRKEISLFELLVELTLHADEEPAQNMIALLAVLNNSALFELEEFDIVNAATYIRDTMRKDTIRWQLKDYRETQEEAKEKKEKKRRKV